MAQAQAGHLGCAVNDHLHGTGPKRILSIDAGGHHSMISLGFLVRMEAMVRSEILRREGPGCIASVKSPCPSRPARKRTCKTQRGTLCETFDLIGGASSGAFIAAGLAKGIPALDLAEAIGDLMRDSLRRRGFLAPRGPAPVFRRVAFLSLLNRLFGCHQMAGPRLRTGLALVMRRAENGQMEILSNHPRCRHARGGVTIADAVRAAMPTLGRPELGRGDAELVRFVNGRQAAYHDAASGAHSDPALALTLFATQPECDTTPDASEAGAPVTSPCGKGPIGGLGWCSGSDLLQVISVGSGRGRPHPDPARDGEDQAQLTEALMQSAGLCLTPRWPVDAATGGFSPETLSGLNDWTGKGARRFAYARYNVDLSKQWLETALGRSLSYQDVDCLRTIRHEDQIEQLFNMGREIADQQIRADQILGPQPGAVSPHARPDTPRPTTLAVA